MEKFEAGTLLSLLRGDYTPLRMRFRPPPGFTPTVPVSSLDVKPL